MTPADLHQEMKIHNWRMRFAFTPVKRIKIVKGCIEHDGYYWWRIIFEVRVGVVPIWTAYAHMNDELKFDYSIPSKTRNTPCLQYLHNLKKYYRG